MNGKKTLPLLVIASLMLSILPSMMFASAALDIPTLSAPSGLKGAVIEVTGDAAQVPAGTVVYLYWDDSTIPWNGVKGLLNSTTAAADGSYEVWFTVPEAKGGNHYLWVKTTTGGIADVISTVFVVLSQVEVSPSRGLPLDTVTVKLYGFDASTDVEVSFDGDAVVTVETNSIGSATTTFKVPTLPQSLIPYIISNDGGAPDVEFIIGPTITVSPSSGPVGTVVSITGRGFLEMDDGIVQGDLAIEGIDCWITTADSINVDATGRIRFNAVIAQVTEDGDFELVLDSAAGDAVVDFEVTAVQKITVTPGYGAQASTITVSGVNFPKIAGEEVAITLDGIPIGTATTLGDGSWSKNCKVPATADGKYDLVADSGDYNIADTAIFKVGTMNIILGEDEGPTGLTVGLTANGFEPLGDWNATIGTEEIGEGVVSTTGTISTTWRVPQLAVGTYTITVWDVDNEIVLTTSFTVTKTTTVTLSVASAPVDFEVGIAGYGFSDADTPLTFVIYNKTSTGALDFWWTPDAITDADLVDGEINEDAVWVVDDVLSKGNYWMNVTDFDDYAVTVPFTVGDVHVVAQPRKASFALGETISFLLEHSFGNQDPIDGSVLKIYNPSGALVFDGDPLGTWTKTGLWYTAPYSSQTAGGNPMVINQDHPIGTWSWKWIDNTGDETVTTGTFAVTEIAAGSVDEKIAALTTQIAAVTTNVNNLQTTVASVATTATAASNAATAASTAASAAATAATAASAAATAAGTKADAAKTAAESAAAAANGLTTLVYAAIGASLIAALAAIVALMQISRKIA